MRPSAGSPARTRRSRRGAEGVLHRLPRQCVVGTQDALFAQQTEQGEQGQGCARMNSNSLPACSGSSAAQARGVEQGLDLPVAVVQRQRGNALQLAAGLPASPPVAGAAWCGRRCPCSSQGRLEPCWGSQLFSAAGRRRTSQRPRVADVDKQQDQPAIDAYIAEVEALPPAAAWPGGNRRRCRAVGGPVRHTRPGCARAG